MSNTPFLLIPGLNSTPEVFRHLTPVLWQMGPVTVANHTEGETIAEIAGAILRDAPPRFALLGFSLGGYLAFEIVRQAPERVAKLCLLDTTARPDSPEATVKRRERIAIAMAGGFSKTLDGAFEDAVHPDHRGRDDLRALSRAMSLAVGPETYVRHQAAIIPRPDSRPTLRTIKVPTAVVVGDSDKITPPEAAQEMAQGIEAATLSVIDRAGHMALLEQPEAVNAAVLAWGRG